MGEKKVRTAMVRGTRAVTMIMRRANTRLRADYPCRFSKKVGVRPNDVHRYDFSDTRALALATVQQYWM